MSFSGFHQSIYRIAVFGLMALGAASGAHAQTPRELVIATTGGAYEQQLRQQFFDPFTRATGIRVVTVSTSPADVNARIKAMTESKAVVWDLYLLGEIQSESPHHHKMNEDMTAFCKKFAGREDLPPGTCKPSGILFAMGSTMLVYNTEKFKQKQPRTWTDFWNVKDFPGPRALPNFNDPWRVLAAALVADGVPPQKLFPLDVDRAFRKMDQIKPEIGLWWKTGDQSVQGFRSGEYVMGMIWQTRAASIKAEGLPLAWSLDQSVLVGDRWALVKGAPNRENALQFLEFYLDHPEAQAKFCDAMVCTPPSRKAVKMMSAEAQAGSPLAPGRFEQLIKPDSAWINANTDKLVERWNRWVQQ